MEEAWNDLRAKLGNFSQTSIAAENPFSDPPTTPARASKACQAYRIVASNGVLRIGVLLTARGCNRQKRDEHPMTEQTGDQPNPYEWVTIAPITSASFTLHRILASHMREAPILGVTPAPDADGWLPLPDFKVLALLLDDPVETCLSQLVYLGAVQLRLQDNHFRLPAHPPDDYQGPRTLADWYRLNSGKWS